MKYKDFSKSEIISFDIETYDPNLKDMGPGVFRKDGYILGIALTDETDFTEYYNIGHYDCNDNERKNNIDYLKEIFLLNNKKLGTFINYDIDWIENWLGLKINGQLYDITIAESLLDENQGKYNLDFMAYKYLNIGKYKNKIDKFCTDNNLKGDSRSWLYKMPYYLVREYAIEDVKLPLKIFKIQWKLMHNEDLLDLFHLECDLIRCLLLMRKVGVRIDTDKRDRNALKIQNIIEENRIKLFNEEGKFNYNSSQQVAKILSGHNIKYPFTRKKNPSINSDFLKANQEKYPLIKSIYELKKADKTLNTFLLGSFVKFITDNDLIHCSFYNMRTDEYGTRSGRLSSAHPNLQQIPALGVDEYWGTICREVFIPFENHDWYKLDWSQIEYRFMAHFAIGPGSKEIVDTYNNNPEQDYHQYIINLTGLKRRFAKNLNFGVAYGMGIKTMCKFFLWTEEYADNILKTYHAKAPFIRSTIDAVEKIAIRRGYIKTILKRRSRLIDKSKAYIMFCRLMQGSAADLMKKAMLDCYNADIFSTLFLHLTVHDELDMSVPRTKQGNEALDEMKYIMEHCIKIKVPIKVDIKKHYNWAIM